MVAGVYDGAGITIYLMPHLLATPETWYLRGYGNNISFGFGKQVLARATPKGKCAKFLFGIRHCRRRNINIYIKTLTEMDF